MYIYICTCNVVGHPPTFSWYAHIKTNVTLFPLFPPAPPHLCPLRWENRAGARPGARVPGLEMQTAPAPLQPYYSMPSRGCLQMKTFFFFWIWCSA